MAETPKCLSCLLYNIRDKMVVWVPSRDERRGQSSIQGSPLNIMGEEVLRKYLKKYLKITIDKFIFM